MHEVIFYKDKKGRRPVRDYMDELRASESKNNRIKLTKIEDYIKVLRMHGTAAGMPYIKHLNGEIWELRPLRDRIFFAGIVNGRYVLLHQFMKQTWKTPAREIEKARRELADFRERSESK